MALELGLGVTPWGPLKSGVLSGKYTRDKHGQHEAGRGAWALSALNDKSYDLLEEMDEGGVLDVAALEDRMQSLYAHADSLADDSLQVMSIHQAKGLEFDTVIVPGLGRRRGQA